MGGMRVAVKLVDRDEIRTTAAETTTGFYCESVSTWSAPSTAPLKSPRMPHESLTSVGAWALFGLCGVGWGLWVRDRKSML